MGHRGRTWLACILRSAGGSLKVAGSDHSVADLLVEWLHMVCASAALPLPCMGA